jgi:hypothetical protein
LSNLLAWVKRKPLAPFEGKPAGYRCVEKTLLVLGLALREVERVLFTEDGSRSFSDYLVNSSLTLVDLDDTMAGCNTLLHDVGLHNVEEPESDDVTASGPGYVPSECLETFFMFSHFSCREDLSTDAGEQIPKPGVNGGPPQKNKAVQ